MGTRFGVIGAFVCSVTFSFGIYSADVLAAPPSLPPTATNPGAVPGSAAAPSAAPAEQSLPDVSAEPSQAPAAPRPEGPAPPVNAVPPERPAPPAASGGEPARSQPVIQTPAADPGADVPSPAATPAAQSEPVVAAPNSTSAPEPALATAEPTAPLASDATTDPINDAAPSYVTTDDAALADSTTETAVKKQGKFARDDFKHAGFILTADIGAMGCTRSVCARGRGLDSAPGVRVGGFLGGNIAGILELGVAGAWGRVTPTGVSGRSLLDVYGIEAAQAQMMASELDFDLSSLIVESAESANGRGGLALRVHFIPKGRVTAYVGSGVGYSLYRSRFATQMGGVRLDFHGVDVPIQGGVAVYVHPKIAFAGQFDYMWTHYLAVYGETPTEQAVAPMGPVDDQLEKMGEQLGGRLPHFWTATLGLRVTL